MNRITGKVQTVMGLIEPKDLGITLPHEHLISDQTNVVLVPPAEADRHYVDEPITLENRWWIAAHHLSNRLNLDFTDENLILKEIRLFQKVGGKSVACLSNIGLGRDPEGLVRIARATGLNVIMGSGYYTANTHSPDMDKKTSDEIAEEIIRDLTEGVGETGIRAGIIGEMGCSWPLRDNERKCLVGAVKAQRRTGAALNIHPGRVPDAVPEIISILDKAGADLSRTVMSHIERTLRNPQDRLRLAETGCCLEYDHFGLETYFQREIALIDLPNDHQRVNELVELIDKGYLKQLLLAHDICLRHRLKTYGGHGYSHLLENAVPLMRDKGISEAEISTMLIQNPARVLPFA